jgi:hypothetical protein
MRSLARVTHALAALALVAVGGCAHESKPDIEAAKAFKRFPLYWLGERFEGWKLSAIVGLDYDAPYITFVYGTCTPGGGDEPSCTPPLEVQVFPFCGDPTSAGIARGRTVRLIRGAPVERNPDGAPILLSRRAEIKVYVGEGADDRAAIRALRALRSANRVPPIITAKERIPPPTPACNG